MVKLGPVKDTESERLLSVNIFRFCDYFGYANISQCISIIEHLTIILLLFKLIVSLLI